MGEGGPVGTIREEFLPFFDLQPRQSSLIKVADKILNNQAFSWLGNICLLKPPQYLPFLQLC